MVLKGQAGCHDCDGGIRLISSGRSEQSKGHEQGQGGEFVNCAYPYFSVPLVLLALSRFHAPGRVQCLNNGSFLGETPKRG